MIITLLSLLSLKTQSIVPHPEVRKIYGKSVLMKIRKSSYIYTLTVGTVYWKNFGRISWDYQNAKCTYCSIQQLWFEPYVSMLLSLLLSRFSRVWLLATPWTAAHQPPPSMGFSRQEYWSGVPLPSLVTNPREYQIVRTLTKETTWI